MSALPAPARDVLRDGVLCYVASLHRAGPHVTPVVYVLDGGRIWLTTSRRSVKARAWRRDRRVAGLVQGGEEAVSFRGVVRAYDALDLSSWPAATVAGPAIARAAARFTGKNARFFAGYAVDAPRVPFAWTPPGRVFVAIRPTEGFVTRGNEIVARWGDADEGAVRGAGTFVRPPRLRPTDLLVPATVREAIGSKGVGALTLADPDGRLTTLPVAWQRSAGEDRYDVVLPVASARAARATDGCPVALTIDRASRWRAADMTGLLVQGDGEVFDPGSVRGGKRDLRARLEALDGADASVLVRVRPRRFVWWDGWTSGTVTAVGRRGRGEVRA